MRGVLRQPRAFAGGEGAQHPGHHAQQQPADQLACAVAEGSVAIAGRHDLHAAQARACVAAAAAAVHLRCNADALLPPPMLAALGQPPGRLNEYKVVSLDTAPAPEPTFFEKLRTYKIPFL